MSGAILPDLVVEKPDGGGKMLNRAFTFDVHKEQSGVIEKEMIVQSGNAQAASKATNIARLTSSSNRTVSPMTMASLCVALVNACPSAESHERRYSPAINGNRDIFAGETNFVGVFLFVELTL